MRKLIALLFIALLLVAAAAGVGLYKEANKSYMVRALEQEAAQRRLENQIARAEAWHDVGVGLVYVAGGSLAAALAGAVLLLLAYGHRRLSTHYAKDGDYGIQIFRRGWLERLILRADQVTVIQPAHQLAPAAVHTTDRRGDVRTAAGLDVADLDRVQRQADHHARTLQTQALGAGIGLKYAAQAKLAAGYYDRPQRMGDAEPPALGPAPRPPLALAEAVRQSENGQIVLGQQSETGALAIWDSSAAQQLAVFGANGTGKTASAASTAVIALVRAGYHTIILDPKGGADWRSFERWTERHDSDAERMGPQLAAVVAEMERRGRLCEEHGVSNVDALPARLKPPAWALILEELGDTRIEAKALGILDDIDTPLDRLMALSRYTGLRIILIDQRPQGWPKRVQANTKELITFRQGMGQGNAVGYYHAHHLANRGEFAMNGDRYDAFHALPQVPTLLADVPALAAPRIVPPVASSGSSGSSGRVQGGVYPAPDTPPARTPESNEPTEPAAQADLEPEETEIQQAARAWIAAHPDGTQTEMREALGVSKGYASELWHRCHPSGRDYVPAPVSAPPAQAGLDWRGMDRATLLDMMEHDDPETAAQALIEWSRRGERISYGGQ